MWFKKRDLLAENFSCAFGWIVKCSAKWIYQKVGGTHTYMHTFCYTEPAQKLNLNSFELINIWKWWNGCCWFVCFLWRCIAFTHCVILPINYIFCQFSWSVSISRVIYEANSHCLFDLLCFSDLAVNTSSHCTNTSWRGHSVTCDLREATFYGSNNPNVKSKSSFQ